ncbi:MAG: stage II sporulation protein M [Bacteroidetes bacterium]|nr:stage II sporulation protein M [Bacteroidota bacterium]
MREATFLRQNAQRWKQFEELLATRKSANPDQLADLFIQLTDDLSYARTHYPQSNTTSYLNGLTSKVHQAIYRNRKERGSRFVTFWRRELPEIMIHARRELIYAVVIFGISIVIGVFSTANDTNFARLILGDGYVSMTIDNIKNGKPMGVYDREDGTHMFMAITTNNVKVSFYAFASGIVLGIFTAYILFYNGVMIGVFHTLLYQYDVSLENQLSVWIHGTLEISAIVIAGAAGLVIGRSILFPKTYSRKDSLQRGARIGVKMVIGLVPIFITAGFLESFVTRYAEMPVAVKLLIIGISATFIVWYFVVYPFILERRIAADAADSISGTPQVA